MIGSIITGAVIYFFGKPKKIKSKKMFTEQDAKNAFQELKKVYTPSQVGVVEKIMRLETAHFTSGNYKLTGSGGMEIATGKNLFPYGWTTPAKLWASSVFRPTGTKTMKENGTGKLKTFLVFPTVKAAVFTIAEVMKNRNFNAGSWFSNNQAEQEKYNKSINAIKARF